MDRVDDDSSPQLMIKEDLELVDCYDDEENQDSATNEQCEVFPTPEESTDTEILQIAQIAKIAQIDEINEIAQIDETEECVGNENLLIEGTEMSEKTKSFEINASSSGMKEQNCILEADIKMIVDKLCEDVIIEEQGGLVERTTTGGLAIKVTKKVLDIAAKFSSSPFSYIRLEPSPTLPTRRPKEVNKRKNFAETSQNGSFDDSSEPSKKRSREDLEKASKHSLFKPKRIKCITESCKVCLAPMDKREFMPDGETFYCSTECIHRKVKMVRKALTTNRDQIFVTDKRGRLHANHVPDIDALECFLLRRPNYEPCVKNNEEEQKQPSSISEEESRIRVRQAFSDEIKKRCSFHDIDLSEKKSKELSHQVEYDLYDFFKSVRVLNYRTWCRAFIKFITISGKVFLDKFIAGTVSTSRLVRIPVNILDSELHKMDEIEAPATSEPIINSEPSSSNQQKEIATNNNEIKPKPSVKLSFPFKYRATPLKPNLNVKPMETGKIGKSAIDTILDDMNKDTTAQHMSHLYSKDCAICKQKTQLETAMLDKAKKTKQDKEKEREMRQTERKDEFQNKKNDRNSNSSRKIEDSFKRGFSDDDISPGFVDDNDSFEPAPPGHSPKVQNSSGRRRSISPIRRRSRSPVRRRSRSPIRRRSRSPIRIPIRSPIRRRSRSPIRRRSRSPRRSPRRRSRFDDPIDPTTSFGSHRRRLSKSPPFGSIPLIRPHPLDDDVEPFPTAALRFESWKQPDFLARRMITPEPEPIMSLIDPHELIVWTGLFDYPKRFKYMCEFSLVKNKAASTDLDKILPESMKVHGLIDCTAVWSYLDSLRSARTKEIITLLMHPPTDEMGYKHYIDFYDYLEKEKRMTVIDCQKCIELKDIYLFSLPAHSSLHPSCNVGDGPGLLPMVQQCPNILAIVVRHAAQRFVNSLGENPPSRTTTPLNGNQSYRKSDDIPSLTKGSILDIPIVEKSPFEIDSLPDKSPYSIKSFSRENSIPKERLSIPFSKNYPQPVPPPVQTQSSSSPIPPPPPLLDDNMDISTSDEEGEINSPSDLIPNLPTLPPPPPPPMLSGLMADDSYGESYGRNFEQPNFQQQPNLSSDEDEMYEAHPDTNIDPMQRFDPMNMPRMPMRGMPMRRPMMRGPLGVGIGRMIPPPNLRGRGGPRPMMMRGRPMNPMNSAGPPHLNGFPRPMIRPQQGIPRGLLNGPPNGLGPMRGRMPPPNQRGMPRGPPRGGPRPMRPQNPQAPSNSQNPNLMPIGSGMFSRPRLQQGPPQRLPFNDQYDISGPRRPQFPPNRYDNSP